MNAEKIIDGLRYCDESAGLCIGCPLDMDFKDDKYCNIRLEAADLIESLQAQLAESQRREMEVDDIADFIIQNEDNIRIAMDTRDRRYLENIIISWLRGPEIGE